MKDQWFFFHVVSLCDIWLVYVFYFCLSGERLQASNEDLALAVNAAAVTSKPEEDDEDWQNDMKREITLLNSQNVKRETTPFRCALVDSTKWYADCFLYLSPSVWSLKLPSLTLSREVQLYTCIHTRARNIIMKNILKAPSCTQAYRRFVYVWTY